MTTEYVYIYIYILYVTENNFLMRPRIPYAPKVLMRTLCGNLMRAPYAEPYAGPYAEPYAGPYAERHVTQAD